MKIRTPADLGALIRDYRIKQGLDQRELAIKAGASRQWIVSIEQGKPRAAIGLVFRTLQALGISIEIPQGAPRRPQGSSKNPVDINQIISSLRNPKK